MQELESPRSQTSCTCLPYRRPPDPVVEPMSSWRDKMVKVRNGSGGWAWVLKSNEAAYLNKNEGGAAAAPAPIS
ncbi:unnamed protein product [Ascophyllum nodosum]